MSTYIQTPNPAHTEIIKLLKEGKKLIALSGPPCSGKTTELMKVKEGLGKGVLYYIVDRPLTQAAEHIIDIIDCCLTPVSDIILDGLDQSFFRNENVEGLISKVQKHLDVPIVVCVVMGYTLQYPLKADYVRQDVLDPSSQEGKDFLCDVFTSRFPKTNSPYLRDQAAYWSGGVVGVFLRIMGEAMKKAGVGQEVKAQEIEQVLEEEVCTYRSLLWGVERLHDFILGKPIYDMHLKEGLCYGGGFVSVPTGNYGQKVGTHTLSPLMLVAMGVIKVKVHDKPPAPVNTRLDPYLLEIYDMGGGLICTYALTDHGFDLLHAMGNSLDVGKFKWEDMDVDAIAMMALAHDKEIRGPFTLIESSYPHIDILNTRLNVMESRLRRPLSVEEVMDYSAYIKGKR